MKTVLPTYNDLSTYFAEVGISLPSQTFCQDLLDSIKEEANDYVGFNLLSPSEASSSVNYDYPINTNILWVPYYNTISNISLNSKNLTANTDYYFYQNREIKFINPYFYSNYGSQNLIITGVVGLGSSIPTHVWRGFLDYACYKIILMNPQRNFTEIKQADVDLKIDKIVDVPKLWFSTLDSFVY